MMRKLIFTIFVILLFCGCSRHTDMGYSSDTVENTDDYKMNNETETTFDIQISTMEEVTTEELTIEELTTETPITEETSTEIQVSDDELNLMQQALLSKVDIFDTEDGEYKKVTELPYYYEDTTFRFIDLDGDGVVEVVLQWMWLSVLKENNGEIYRYPMSHRVRFNEDGTVSGSAGADYNTLFRISFTETEIVDEYIYWAIDGKVYKTYDYEGEKIEFTEEEWAEIQEKYPEIMIDSYEFNHNNIVTLLGGE